MRKSRDPFAIETAEGFPVVERIPSSGPHRRTDVTSVSKTKKNEEKVKKCEMGEDNSK